jgi:hypothetical protein
LERLLTIQSLWRTAVTAALVALNVAVFCLVPEYPLGPGTQRLLTCATLVNSDRYYQDRFTAIEENFAPESTAILAAKWHHVEYYLPTHISLKWERAQNPSAGNIITTPAELGLSLDVERQAIIVVFDSELSAFNESPASVRELPIKHGDALNYFVLGKDQAFYYGAGSFGISE